MQKLKFVLIVLAGLFCTGLHAKQGPSFNRIDTAAKAREFAEALILSAYPQVDSEDHDRVRDWLAYLLRRYNSLSAFVQDLKEGPTRDRLALSISYRGHVLNFTSLIFFLGPDPKTRPQDHEAIRALEPEILATTLFIQAGFEQVLSGHKKSARYSNIEFAATLLPFISDPKQRDELLSKLGLAKSDGQPLAAAACDRLLEPIGNIVSR